MAQAGGVQPRAAARARGAVHRARARAANLKTPRPNETCPASDPGHVQAVQKVMSTKRSSDQEFPATSPTHTFLTERRPGRRSVGFASALGLLREQHRRYVLLR